AEFVMNLPCNRFALFFANCLQTRRQSTELITRCFELVFCAPAVGYFGPQFLVDLGENGGSLLDVLLQKVFSFCQGHFFLSPFGYVSCELDKSAQRPARISESGDDDVGPEPGAVFSNSPSFILAVSVAAGVRQHLSRLAPHHGFSGIKDGKMF